MTMDFVDDSAAVEAARLGNRAAFEWLVRRHQRRALSVALGVLRNKEDARDACQEAFLRVFRSIESFDGESRFSTWLHRIVVNICIDRLRARTSAGLVALDDFEGVIAGDDNPARRIENMQLGGLIDAALGRLKPKHRTALLLREVQGLSYQEIANAMGTSIGTVMSRLFHARKNMQALLIDEEPALAAAA
jgi:RNA polymerase sigma-70 factor (ECF subfamily)